MSAPLPFFPPFTNMLTRISICRPSLTPNSHCLSPICPSLVRPSHLQNGPICGSIWLGFRPRTIGGCPPSRASTWACILILLTLSFCPNQYGVLQYRDTEICIRTSEFIKICCCFWVDATRNLWPYRLSTAKVCNCWLIGWIQGVPKSLHDRLKQDITTFQSNTALWQGTFRGSKSTVSDAFCVLSKMTSEQAENVKIQKTLAPHHGNFIQNNWQQPPDTIVG